MSDACVFRLKPMEGTVTGFCLKTDGGVSYLACPFCFNHICPSYYHFQANSAYTKLMIEAESGSSYESESEEESEEEEDDDDEGTAIEVVCPPGVRAGDTLEVRVPKKVGGGRVTATVPAHIKAGEVFEVMV